MSSELENVKNQVQLAAKSIDDTAQATQTAYSNADEKKERLNAMGQHASSQGLEQVCEKLQQAMATLGTAHGEVVKAITELQGVATTMPIPEALPKLTTATAVLDTAATNLNAAGELVTNAKNDAQQVGVEGIVAVCQGALDMIDAAKATVHTASNAVSEYHKRLEQEAKELTGLNTGASAPNPASGTTPTATSSPSDDAGPGAGQLGGSQQSWSDLAGFRKRNGMPVAGSQDDRDTASKLEIGGKSFFGRNAHGRIIDIKVNSITKTHAEADVFQQLKNAGNTTRHAVMYVDRDLCPPCGPSGGVGSLMRGAGVETLTVHSPSGTFTIDATKRPSRPVAVEDAPK